MSLKTTAQITFHQIPHSDALEADLRDKIDELEQIHDGIVGCRVVVEHDHFSNKHRKGEPHEERGPVTVRFELSVRGGKTIVGGGPGSHAEPVEDPFLAARAAFEVTRRQLQAHLERRRGFTKTHEADAGAQEV